MLMIILNQNSKPLATIVLVVLDVVLPIGQAKIIRPTLTQDASYSEVLVLLPIS